MADSKKKNKTDTQRLALTGLLFAGAMVLSVAESMLPPVPVPVPGVKFGLSNIAVMYALFFLGGREAYFLACLKSVFVFAMRGAVAGALSLAGGVLSVSVMLFLYLLFKERLSYLSVSMFGAIFHNIGQFLVILLLYTGMNMWPYLPVLILSGIAAGAVTATLLRFLIPSLSWVRGLK